MRPSHDVLADAAREQYVTVEYAAMLAGRRQQTIRNWATQGHIRTRRHDGRVFVHALDALDMSATRPRRKRAPSRIAV